MWKEFKKESLRNVDNRIVYMGLLNDKIIAEATAIISEKDLDMQNKEDLVVVKFIYQLLEQIKNIKIRDIFQNYINLWKKI